MLFPASRGRHIEDKAQVGGESPNFTKLLYKENSSQKIILYKVKPRTWVTCDVR